MAYTVTSVTTLPDLHYFAEPPGSQGSVNTLNAIGNSGEVVGDSNGASNSNATAWQGLAVTGLGALADYSFSDAFGVNDLGQVVGESAADIADLSHATLWQDGTAVALGNPQIPSVAFGINDSGQVVGQAGAINAPGHAVLWQNGTTTYLPELPGVANTSSYVSTSTAYAINNAGQIVGAVLDSKGVDHGALWQNGTLTDLGDPYGMTVARAINAAGQVVGNSGSSAFLWQAGVMTTLPLLQESGFYATSAAAVGINDAGIIVGETTGYGANADNYSLATIWIDGVAIDLNSLLAASSKATLSEATGVNDLGQILADGNDGPRVLTLGSAATPQSAAMAELAFAAGTLSAPAAIQDTAADIQHSVDQLQALAAAGRIASIALTDPTTPTLTVSPAQLLRDEAVLQDITGNYALSVSGPVAAAALTSTSGAHLTSVTVLDSAAAIAANILNIEGVAEGGGLKSVQLTDSGIPTLTLPDYQQADSKALAAISGPYQLALTDVDAQYALTDSAQANVVSVAVTLDDFVASNYLDALQTIAAEGKLASITVQPGFSTSNSANTPLLSIDPGQITTDAGALAKIIGDYDVDIQVSATLSQSIQGIADHPNEATFSGTAASYSFTALGDAKTMTVAGNGISDSVAGVQALVFSDHELFVAQAPVANGATSGNVTELYAAVLGREPDLDGLAYYEEALAANPTLSMATLAQSFIASPEYVGKHSYAATAAGDAQFITDTYTNLLHRAPEAGAVAWYQANVIDPIIGNAVPGSAAYATAQMRAHALMLVDFSASAEFLADVQVTAQHPADAQHWLVLS